MLILKNDTNNMMEDMLGFTGSVLNNERRLKKLKPLMMKKNKSKRDYEELISVSDNLLKMVKSPQLQQELREVKMGSYLKLGNMKKFEQIGNEIINNCSKLGTTIDPNLLTLTQSVVEEIKGVINYYNLYMEHYYQKEEFEKVVNLYDNYYSKLLYVKSPESSRMKLYSLELLSLKTPSIFSIVISSLMYSNTEDFVNRFIGVVNFFIYQHLKEGNENNTIELDDKVVKTHKKIFDKYGKYIYQNFLQYLEVGNIRIATKCITALNNLWEVTYGNLQLKEEKNPGLFGYFKEYFQIISDCKDKLRDKILEDNKKLPFKILYSGIIDNKELISEDSSGSRTAFEQLMIAKRGNEFLDHLILNCPDTIYEGELFLKENNNYLIFEFEKSSYVFAENRMYGNATYIVKKDNWKEILGKDKQSARQFAKEQNGLETAIRIINHNNSNWKKIIDHFLKV